MSNQDKFEWLTTQKVTITNASSLPVNIPGRLTRESVEELITNITRMIDEARVDELEHLEPDYDNGYVLVIDGKQVNPAERINQLNSKLGDKDNG